ncbi:uncharacterized protein LOC144924884 isoform X2 [Branchiostoma floridae x Branchiostoma belcheri]
MNTQRLLLTVAVSTYEDTKQTREKMQGDQGEAQNGAGSGNDSNPHPDPPEPRYQNAQNIQEETYGYKEPEDVSSAYKARDRVIEIFNRVKASKLCWLLLVFGLKMIVFISIAAILVPYVLPGMKETYESTDDAGMVTSGKLEDPTTQWPMTVFDLIANSSEIGPLTSPYLPSGWETGESPTGSNGTAETSPFPVTSLHITGGKCQRGWSEYNNHCYKLVDDKVNWLEANSRCKRLGANLASILNHGETYFIKSLTPKAARVWIGLHKVEKQWKWSDGSLLRYKNWRRGEPNNLKGREKCAFVYLKTVRRNYIGRKKKRGLWNDSNCCIKIPFLCKIPQKTVNYFTVTDLRETTSMNVKLQHVCT